MSTASALNRNCTEHSVLGSPSAAQASLAFYTCLGVIGVIGNTHVVLVFRTSRERSLRFLVLFLSCLDLGISGLILPLDCYRVYSEFATGGRLRWHFLGTVILSSRQAAFELEGCVLVLIAVDRFLCVVKARQDGLSYRRTVAALVASAAAVVALETGNVVTHYVIEEDCDIKPRLEAFLLVFYGALGTCSILVIAGLYARILCFVAAMQRRRSHRRRHTRRTLNSLTAQRRPRATLAASSTGPPAPSQSPCQATTPIAETAETPTVDAPNGHQQLPRCAPLVQFNVESRPAADDVGVDAEDSDGPADCTKQCGPSQVAWFPLRLALMLFGASVLFYLSLLPGILINFNIVSDSPLHRLYYLNSSLNFAVYALFNPKFRSDLRGLYSKRCRL